MDSEKPKQRDLLAADELQESLRTSSQEDVPIEVISDDKVQHDLVSVEVHIP
jgi:hypothetical protein